MHDLEQRWVASAASAESAKAECAQMATQYYATKAELDAKMTKIAADVNALPESWASTQGEIPYEQRTEAYMGNLGWDLSVKELEDYGRAALHEAGVDGGSWSKLRAKVGRNQLGSGVVLTFQVAQKLFAARDQLRALKKQGTTGRVIYLDAAKTRRELRPSRLTHRAHDFLQRIENEKTGPKETVVKHLDGKYLTISDANIGYSDHGCWKWTSKAADYYSSDQLDICKTFAEAE